MVTTAIRRPSDWLADALLELAPGERVYATGIPWAMYTRLADLRDERRSGVKITFDRGRIEIMSPKIQHEQPHFRLGLVVMTLAEEFGIEIVNAGATTLRRERGEQGLEADESFYIANAAKVMGVKDIDLSIHPPPDLVIEIDLTASSVSKEGIYAKLRVPEVWRADDRITFRHLQSNGSYQTMPKSLAFPLVASEALTQLFVDGQDEGEVAFLRLCRTWVRSLVASPAS
jgi:Uma2 family endonuclease